LTLSTEQISFLLIGFPLACVANNATLCFCSFLSGARDAIAAERISAPSIVFFPSFYHFLHYYWHHCYQTVDVVVFSQVMN
jgi:hypothetical protein